MGDFQRQLGAIPCDCRTCDGLHNGNATSTCVLGDAHPITLTMSSRADAGVGAGARVVVIVYCRTERLSRIQRVRMAEVLDADRRDRILPDDETC